MALEDVAVVSQATQIQFKVTLPEVLFLNLEEANRHFYCAYSALNSGVGIYKNLTTFDRIVTIFCGDKNFSWMLKTAGNYS